MNLPTRLIVMILALLAWMALAIFVQVHVISANAAWRLPVLVPAMLWGAVTGGGFVLLIGLLAPRRHCPKCEAVLPRFRKPKSWRQALFGGQHCAACHVTLDRHGRVRKVASISSSSEVSPL
jgi:hypothetical protein